MKRAAVFLVVSFACLSQTFAVLRPLFPIKPEPPLRGGAIIGDENISPSKSFRKRPRFANDAEMEVAIYSGKMRRDASETSPLSELALALVGLDHVTSFMVKFRPSAIGLGCAITVCGN
jgi:hypothetical protein